MAIIASDTQEPEGFVGWEAKNELLRLLHTSSYEGRAVLRWYYAITGFDIDKENYEAIKANLLANQTGIDGSVNPSYKQIWKEIKRKIKE